MTDETKQVADYLMQKLGPSFDAKKLHLAGPNLSYSNVTKILSTYTEDEIRKNNMLPSWIQVGKRRVWTATAVAQWLTNTEKTKKNIKTA